MHPHDIPPDKKINYKSTTRKLFSFLKPQRALLLVIFVTQLLAVAADLAVPSIIGMATDYVTTAFGGSFLLSHLAMLLGIAAVLYLLNSVFNFLGDFFAAFVSQRLVYQLRKDVKEKLDRLPLEYFDKNSKGDIMSRVSNDTDTISNTIQQNITQIIWAVASVIGVTVIMFISNPWLALITIATLPLFLLVGALFMRRSRVLFVRQQKELGHLNGHIEEMYSGHNVIKLYGQEDKSVEKFDDINKRLVKAAGNAQGISGMIMPAMGFIGNAAYIAICVVAAFLIGGNVSFAKPITLGKLMEFLQYRNKFTQPINNVANIANVIQSTLAAAARIFEILDAPEETPDTAPIEGTANVTPVVEFKNVNFSYSKDRPLIKNLDFTVPAGGSIAIVGPTGAGKTTLVNLLMRFYEVDEGEILIDGKNIKDYNRNDLRSLFGMVLQDTWLFSGTIKENIAYGKPDATEEQIRKAAKSAHAHHFIMTQEHGYETVLNEDSSNVSQGQKQLITIARAILKDPKILILDEATSSVDTRTEQHIQTAMANMMRGKTSFVIAHRLSTIKNASLILVMNDGTVIEQGTHQALLAKMGFYADMYYSQFFNEGEQQ